MPPVCEVTCTALVVAFVVTSREILTSPFAVTAIVPAPAFTTEPLSIRAVPFVAVTPMFPLVWMVVTPLNCTFRPAPNVIELEVVVTEPLSSRSAAAPVANSETSPLAAVTSKPVSSVMVPTD